MVRWRYGSENFEIQDQAPLQPALSHNRYGSGGRVMQMGLGQVQIHCRLAVSRLWCRAVWP